jgi:anthranilate synthase/aminodeoxychorismate synthase-like glutamine amidotransferase
MILLIDNYDSFVYNLARYFEELGEETMVVRNDALTASDALRLDADALVLSPGPGRPADAGISIELVEKAPPECAILGVCLGQQSIAEACGGRTDHAPVPVHGKLSSVSHGGIDLFTGIPSPFEVTRYHSLTVSADGLPEALEPLAWAEDGTLMALRHRDRSVWGVQFHPEALLTQHGHAILANFLALARGKPPCGTEASLPGPEFADPATIR